MQAPARQVQTSDPRWHTGRQRTRAEARLSLRLLGQIPPGCCPTNLGPGLLRAAAALNHHGSAVPKLAKSHLALFAMAKRKRGGARQGNQAQRQAGARAVRSPDDWCCKLCLGADGRAYRNFGDRKSCNKCKVAKGSCFLGKADEADGRAPSTTLADRQIKRQRLDNQAKLLQAKDAQIAKLKQEVAAARHQPGDADDAPTADADTLQQEVDRRTYVRRGSCRQQGTADPVTEHNDDADNADCPVCMNTFSQQGTAELRCGHKLCLACYSKVVCGTGAAPSSNSCPFCRAGMLSSSAFHNLRQDRDSDSDIFTTMRQLLDAVEEHSHYDSESEGDDRSRYHSDFDGSVSYKVSN